MAFQSQHRYVFAEPLPAQLQEYCKIYLEEKLYAQALALLSSVLTSPLSVVTQHPRSLPGDYNSVATTHIPSVAVIALLATISIHPSLASAAASPEKQAASDASLHYLHALNSIVGPVNGRFNDAFRFHQRNRGGRRLRTSDARQIRRVSTLSEDEGSEDTTKSKETLHNDFADDKAIWTQAQDFWQILGWSFNCAARFPLRWTFWKSWLEFMICALEDDWAARSPTLQVGQNSKNGMVSETTSDGTHTLEESILVDYVGGTSHVMGRQGQADLRRILRALFADGEDKDVNEFGPIWAGETVQKAHRKSHETRELKQINLEEGDFGDYFDDESSEGGGLDLDSDVRNATVKQEEGEGLEPSRKKRRSGEKVDSVQTSPSVSSTESRKETLPLRRRLITLLMKLSAECPSHFITPAALVDMLEECMRPLQMDFFVALIAHQPSTSVKDSNKNPEIPQGSYPPSMHMNLLQEISRPLLAGSGSSAPTRRDYYLDQSTLEKSYLPFAVGTDGTSTNGTKSHSARTLVGNARYSLCLENMMRLLHDHGAMSSENGELSNAVEKGIRARMEKVKGRIADGEESVQARKWLESSRTRLEFIVRSIERDKINT